MAQFWIILFGIFLIQDAESVTFGEDALPGEYPYQVSIQVAGIKRHHCGGVIVNENYVLTAGHCMKGLEDGEFEVVSGVIDLRKRKFVTNVVDINVYDGYTVEKEWKDDLALLKVSPAFKFDEFTKAAMFPKPDDDYEPNTLAYISGFGRETEHSSYTSNVLKKAEVTVDPLDLCKENYKKTIIEFTESHLCVFDNSTPKQGICKGDSGGPLSLEGVVIGVASFADHGCANEKLPTVFIKLSKYVDWIYKNTKL